MVFVARGARAEVIALDFEASPECPTRGDFVDNVRQRTSTWQENGDAKRMAIVRLEKTPNGAGRGTLTMVEGGDSEEPRVIEGADCEEAARALSFVLALTVDPSAVDRPRVPAVTPAAEAEEEDEKEDPSKPPRLKWSTGVLGEGLELDTPSRVLALGLFGELRPLSWIAVRLAVHRTTAATFSANNASLRWTFVRAEPCIGALTLGPLSFRPCTYLDLGALSGDGGAARLSIATTRPWSVLGTSGRLELALSRRIELELALHVGVPLTQDRLSYVESDPFFETPIVVGSLTAGASIRF